MIYLQKLRTAAAKRLLEGDHRTMQEISDASMHWTTRDEILRREA